MSAASTAEAMGRRAGEDFRATGVPTRNPFTRTGPAELAAAWRRGYFTGQRPG